MGVLNNLSLRYKILIPGIIGVISFAVYLIVNFSASQTNTKMLVKVQDMYLPILERAAQNIGYLDKIKQDLIFAATAGEQSMIDESEKISERMKNNVKDLARLDPGNADKVQAIDQALSDYLDTVIPLTKSMINGTVDMSLAQTTMKRMKDRLKDLESLLGQYSTQSRSDFVSAIEQVNKRSRDTIIVGLLLGITTMVLLANFL